MNGKRVFALLMVLLLLAGAMLPAAAFAEESDRIVHIRSGEDLARLAADCALDTWSTGVSVILDNDLDFSGEDIPPIPTFNGTFEGGGHTITGMTLSSDGSNQGLFRFLQEKGVVRNLKVKGQVMPESGRNYVGGLVGTNYGSVENCSFDGTVSGLNYVGGLVGENHGSIHLCDFNGTVDGKRFTGGIAGYNDGIINGCVNQGAVNTSVSEEKVNLADIASSSTGVALGLLNAEDENIVSDSGGVVGFSKGVVLACDNHGVVGYPHYGYNVGGVAGRQSGYLSGCSNYGDVLGRKDVAGIVGQMEPYLDLVESINLADELVALNAYLNNASGDLAAMADEMRSLREEAEAAKEDGGSSGGTISHVGENPQPADGGSGSGSISHAGESSAGGSSDSGSILDSETGGEIIGRIEDKTDGSVTEGDIKKISGDMGAVADSLKGAYEIISSNGSDLAYDLSLANDQFTRVLTLMANALNGATNNQVFEDVSDQLGEKDTEGRVSGNVNYGAVDGDNNVGGIAGSMGVEYEFDLEDNLIETVGANGIVNNTYDAKCVSSGNVNQGKVVAKKDRAGGVVGSSELGAVLSCESYGAVESTEGSYVGGVAGYSSTSIRGSYAMCSVNGTRYVGGIAGYANEITDNASIMETGSKGAFTGAIAGWADANAENMVKDNVYVHESLGAIDGISYSGKAMPVKYEELIARKGVPARFKTVTLTFLVDGSVVRELTLDYGGDVDESQIPEVPARSGYTGKWTEFEKQDVRYSASIEAVYTLNQSTLASEEMREDSPMSVVLLEGEFEGGLALELQPYEGEGPQVENGTPVESWELRINGMSDGDKTYTVRYVAPEAYRGKTLQVFCRNADGDWEQVETGTSGSYLTFPAQGDQVVFSVVSTERGGWKWPWQRG